MCFKEEEKIPAAAWSKRASNSEDTLRFGWREDEELEGEIEIGAEGGVEERGAVDGGTRGGGGVIEGETRGGSRERVVGVGRFVLRAGGGGVVERGGVKRWGGGATGFDVFIRGGVKRGGGGVKEDESPILWLDIKMKQVNNKEKVKYHCHQ